jgi:hypothetical protein
MYNFLLTDGDILEKLDVVRKFDIQDYINMREQRLPSMVKWLSIRSMNVTKYGRTVWQLTELYLNSEKARAIGIIEPPLNLMKWIIGKY